MNLFDVYPLYPITPVKALDCIITDDNGIEYLDLYSGHGVISIGHTQPDYVAKIKAQLDNLSFTQMRFKSYKLAENSENFLYRLRPIFMQLWSGG
jgi:4-aminobutyrate aminotransferase-like enzyme